MPHVVDDMLIEAQRAIADMRAAALHARSLHACAELLRHMRGAAAKAVAKTGAAAAADEAAIARTTDEWMQAWGLGRDAYPDLAAPFRAFTAAFTRDARHPTPETSAAIAEALRGLEAALAGVGTSVADQMAFRSECAHGWWAMVVPVPEDLPGRRERAGIPKWREGMAFWEVGAAARCGADITGKMKT